MSKINKYSFVKSLMFSFLALFILVGMYGGCGSSGGGNNPPPTNPPPTNAPPTDPPPTNPPPTQPPPTQPPSQCQLPPLNTDFSDLGFFFIDDFTNVLIGVTSTGNDVVMTLSDIPDSGALLGIFGGVTSSDTCLIDTLVIDDLLFPASGLCVRSNNGSTFSVLDFESLGVELVDVIGECDTVVPLGTSQFSLEQNLMDTSSRLAVELKAEQNLNSSESEANSTVVSDFVLDVEEMSVE